MPNKMRNSALGCISGKLLITFIDLTIVKCKLGTLRCNNRYYFEVIKNFILLRFYSIVLKQMLNSFERTENTNKKPLASRYMRGQWFFQLFVFLRSFALARISVMLFSLVTPG